MTAPTVHMNGTHPEDLLAGFVEAYRALGEAYDALAKASPNGRDYYPQPGNAIAKAQDEHRARLAAIDAMRDEMLALAEHVQSARPDTGPLARNGGAK